MAADAGQMLGQMGSTMLNMITQGVEALFIDSNGRPTGLSQDIGIGADWVTLVMMALVGVGGIVGLVLIAGGLK